MDQTQIADQILANIDFKSDFKTASIQNYDTTYNDNTVRLAVSSIDLDQTQIADQILGNIDFNSDFKTASIQNYDTTYNDNTVRLAVDKIDLQVAQIMNQISVVNTTQEASYTLDFNGIPVSVTVDSEQNVTKSLLNYSFGTFFSDVNDVVDALTDDSNPASPISDSQKDELKAWIIQTSLYTGNNSSEITSTTAFDDITWTNIENLADNLTTALIDKYQESSPYYIAVVVLLQELASLANTASQTTAETGIQNTLDNISGTLETADIFEIIRIDSNHTTFANIQNGLTVTEYTPTGEIVSFTKSYLDQNNNYNTVTSTTISSTAVEFPSDIDTTIFSTPTTLITHVGVPNPNGVTKSYLDQNDNYSTVTSTTISSTAVEFPSDIDTTIFSTPTTLITHVGVPNPNGVTKSYLDQNDNYSTVTSTTISSTAVEFPSDIDTTIFSLNNTHNPCRGPKS